MTLGYERFLNANDEHIGVFNYIKFFKLLFILFLKDTDNKSKKLKHKLGVEGCNMCNTLKELQIKNTYDTIRKINAMMQRQRWELLYKELH